ncbi:MAG TPA: valine--tRNA ligase [Candidatus Dormibacteraeota bacterium]|nr:valine--tRNA ligase [Candidatus Dormibacteraeota bacterium]
MSASNAKPSRTTPYDPKAVEARLYERWEQRGYFHEEADPARPPFIICMPPPNVTARAHIGHGSTYTPMDALVRYRRMCGDNADWLPGTDHAAIATEAVLVRELAREGTTRENLGREKYLERAWAWARGCAGAIERQFRALGFGPDWARSRFTMDEGLSVAVRRVFVTLYRDGLLYRGKRLVNWDPVAKTTISDAEVEHEERDATLWHVTYPAADGPGGITVATTRPETMLGDVAIAVHPEDARYRAWIGASVLVPPLLVRKIPVVADAAVDPAFGSGAVKVTPGHDVTDFEIGERHGLPVLSIMDLEGRITAADVDVGAYVGLDRTQARARISADLREAGLVVKEEPYRHAIAVSERTGAVIEPLLLEQWFVKAKPLARPALDAYRDGRVRFVPERYGRTYEQWLENIRDWNVSRQVWWGHQLPVWYTPDGATIVAESEDEALAQAQERYGTRELTRDPDTLDTWFSSALWPFSILGWPEKTLELECWYPSQTLVTGGEIIFLWVARMVMLGLYVMGKAPFRDVFVTPLVFDAQGRKMSKSLGNAIDPMELVEKYGADAFRMGVLRQLRVEAQEVRFQESRCEEARNFNNKIWNATRYVLSLPERLPNALTLPKIAALTLADRWILTRLHDTILEVGSLLDGYDIGNAAERIWHFIWYEFCDWYVEATKLEEAGETRAAVLTFVLNNAMRLLHPLAPFITEEVWLALPHDGDTIMTAAWPDPLEVPVDREAAGRMEALRDEIVRLRNERAKISVPPGEVLGARGAPVGIGSYERELYARLAGVRIEAGAAVSGRVEIEAPAGLVRERYEKERARLRAEVERGEKKLGNAQFVAHAKADVVQKEREKLERYRSELEDVERAMSDMSESTP